MASFIITRNAIQCRSHHIKLLRTFRTIDQIKKNFVMKVGETAYSMLMADLTSTHTIFQEPKKNLFEQKEKSEPVCTSVALRVK